MFADLHWRSNLIVYFWRFQSFHWFVTLIFDNYPWIYVSNDALNHFLANSSAKNSLKRALNVVFFLFCILVDRPIGGSYSPLPPPPPPPASPMATLLLVLRHIMVNLVLINALRLQKGYMWAWDSNFYDKNSPFSPGYTFKLTGNNWIEVDPAPLVFNIAVSYTGVSEKC